MTTKSKPGKLYFEIVTDSEPDPEIERLLNYMSKLGRIADTCEWWISSE